MSLNQAVALVFERSGEDFEVVHENRDPDPEGSPGVRAVTRLGVVLGWKSWLAS